MTTEILVKAFAANDEKGDVFTFDTIEAAASYMHDAHFDDEYGFVLEVEKMALGNYRGHDRREDFERAWMKLEYTKYRDSSPYKDGTHRHDGWLDQMQVPVWRGAKYPSPTIERGFAADTDHVIAAE